MDQNHNDFRPEEGSSGNQNANYQFKMDGTFTDYTPVAKPKKRSKKILWITLISLFGAALLAAVIMAGALFIPVTLGDPLQQTVSEVFFDPEMLVKLEEAWSQNGYEGEMEIDLPSDITSLYKDLTLRLEMTEIPDAQQYTSGELQLTLKAGKKELTATIVYDADTIAVGGLCEDAEQYVTLPRKNVKQALEDSAFHPDSKTRYALEKEDYETLRTALELLSSDPDDENKQDIAALEKSIEAILMECNAIVVPETSFYFAENAFCLCKEVKYTFNEKDLHDILNIVIDEAEENKVLNELMSADNDGDGEIDEDTLLVEVIRDIKKDLDEDFELTFSYVISNGKISSASFSNRYTDEDDAVTSTFADLLFVYEEDQVGFDLSLKEDSEWEDELYSTETQYVYRKETKNDKTKIKLSVTNRDTVGSESFSQTFSETSDMTLTYDHENYEYCLEFEDSVTEETVKIEGEFELDPEKGTLRLTMDQVKQGKTKLFEASPLKISVKSPKAPPQINVPDGASILEMTETDFTQLLRNLPAKSLDDWVSSLTGTGLDFSYTVEGKLLLNPLKVQQAANRCKTRYRSYLKQNSDLPAVNRVWVYNEEHDIYILMQYMPSQDDIKVEYAYELSDSHMKNYHEAILTSDGLTVHEPELKSEQAPKCEVDGSTTYYCAVCDKTITVKIPATGHWFKASTKSVVTDDNQQRTASIQHCRDCDAVFTLTINNFYYVEFDPDGSGAYRIQNYYAYSGLANEFFSIPEALSEMITVSDTNTLLPAGILSFRVPNGVNTLYRERYTNMHDLQVLILPSTLKKIENNAFPSDITLKRIYYCGTEEQWKTVNLNNYAGAWKNVEVIFAPDGVSPETISKSVFSPALAAEALQVYKQITTDIAKADALATAQKNVTLIDRNAVQAVDYNAGEGLIAVCGKYDGASTPIRVYSSKTFELQTEFQVNDHIHAIAIGEGYVALASYLDTKVYVYRLSNMDLKTLVLDSYPRNDDHVGQIFIVDGYVYACTVDQWSTVMMYHLATESTTRVPYSCYEPILYLNRAQHRLAIVDQNISRVSIHFYSTETATFLKTVTVEDGFTDKVYFRENYVETSAGAIYDLSGNSLEGVPDSLLGPQPVQITLPSGNVELEQILASESACVVLYWDSEYQVKLALRNASSTENTVLDYYAECALVTASGDILLYTPGGYGLMLVKMS